MRFIIMICLILGANSYVFFRIWNLIPAGNILRPISLVLGIVAVSSMFIAILTAGSLPSAVTSFLYILGSSWFFIMLYLLMLFLLLDIGRLVHLLPKSFLLGNWMVLGGITALLTIIFTIGYITYQKKDRVELNLDVPAGVSLDNPLKIVALSDVHIGYTIGKKELARWVELINAENPDIVLIAGDITDNNVRPLIEQDMASVFRQIRSKYGVYACAGNHEYIGGLAETLAFEKKAGITVLRDSAVLIDNNFYIVGRDDRTNTQRESIGGLVDTLDRTKPVILLDHQPYHLEEAEENGITLQISGHTHDGQVWPVSMITRSMYEVSHGYKKKKDTHIYVSSGIGIWGGKFRIGTRSEYVVINLE